MSNLKHFIRKAVPIVLTVVGSASTVAAVIFAAKEGPKYMQILEEKGSEIKPIEKFATAVKVFAPAIGCATASIACAAGTVMFDASTQASIMGLAAAAQQGYKNILKKNEEINGPEANKKIFKAICGENFPDDEHDENGEKIYTVHLKNVSETALEEVTFRDTKEGVLLKAAAVNMELGKCGHITYNRLLELFELSEHKTINGEFEGWSCWMLGDWGENPWLVFDYVLNNDGSLTLYTLWPAYEGYLLDYGIEDDCPVRNALMDSVDVPLH